MKHIGNFNHWESVQRLSDIVSKMIACLVRGVGKHERYESFAYNREINHLFCDYHDRSFLRERQKSSFEAKNFFRGPTVG